jgi:hypothetical protein
MMSLGCSFNVVTSNNLNWRWRDRMIALHIRRNFARFRNEVSGALKKPFACGKQRLPVDTKVIPAWPQRLEFGRSSWQRRVVGLLRCFCDRQRLCRPSGVGHSK